MTCNTYNTILSCFNATAVNNPERIELNVNWPVFLLHYNFLTNLNVPGVRNIKWTMSKKFLIIWNKCVILI